MNLNTVLARLPFWYKSRKCVYLKSPPGRGKTTVLSAAPKLLSDRFQMNLGLVVINGPLLTPADSIGYLIPKHMPDGRTESLYTDPFWFRTNEGKRLDEYDGGIIVVDEMDKADVDVKKVIGEAALSGRLGPHELPKGWVVWMAGNRQADRSGSTKELDHLINRRMEIDVTDDIESWTDWASKNNIMPLTIAFAHQNPQIVFSDGVPEKQGPWCTPRSLVEADSYLQVLSEAGETDRRNGAPDDPTTVEEIAGMIGDGAAAQLFAFVRLEREMPRYEDIVANPMKCRVPSKPDAQMLVCYNMAHRITTETADPVVDYIERFPKEFSVIFAKAAIQRDYKLVSTKAFTKWVNRNAALMAVISR